MTPPRFAGRANLVGMHPDSDITSTGDALVNPGTRYRGLTMWETVPRLLAAHRYLVIGTTNDDNRPWVTPVFYAADGEHRIVWVSAPESRHSRNIAARPDVAITVFDSHAPIGGAEALYLEGTAALVADDGHAAGLALLNARLPAGKQLGPEDLGPAGPMRLYQATIARHHVLIRGGDSRFDNVTDARMPVTAPGSER